MKRKKAYIFRRDKRVYKLASPSEQTNKHRNKQTNKQTNDRTEQNKKTSIQTKPKTHREVSISGKRRLVYMCKKVYSEFLF